MNLLAHLLLITALSIQTSVLVLRSGERISVDGSVSVDNGRVVFRSGGGLYSIPSSEVDLDATRAMAVQPPVVRAEIPSRIRVTPEERDRLLRELEQNHSGTPAPESNVPPVTVTANRQRGNDDEWGWRRQAQAHEEAIRRAREELDMLRSRAEQLQDRVRALLAQGFKPSQFTYDTTQLQHAVDSIPRAELELRRAEREFEQFRENARRQGVMPGWLR